MVLMLTIALSTIANGWRPPFTVRAAGVSDPIDFF